MADFCMQCSLEEFGQDLKELAGLCEEGMYAAVICEGCGYTVVDYAGRCVDPECLGTYPNGKKHAHHTINFDEWGYKK